VVSSEILIITIILTVTICPREPLINGREGVDGGSV
jgi:hypothetical protein